MNKNPEYQKENCDKKKNNDTHDIQETANKQSLAKGGDSNERLTEKSDRESVKKERNTLNYINNIKILGLKEFRSNISDIVSLAINSFQEILTGNAKKGGKTVSLIATDLLDSILEGYKFSPSITVDEETKQYEIILKEIDAAGTGESKEEAIEVVVDNTVMLTDDFFDNIELYMRMEQYKKQYPYFMRIKHCENRNQLRKVLSLD